MKPLPVFTAVVHVSSEQQAVKQTDLALSCGAGGVFLIAHGASHTTLLTTYGRVREHFPEAWLGINFLDLNPQPAARATPPCADALWLDNADGLSSGLLDPARNWRVFAGAAFKYQRRRGSDENEASWVADAFDSRDVVTTSGPGTGMAVDSLKLERMKAALGSRHLALASGVRIENVADYRPFVDCFLVATGISHSFHELDPGRVRELADALHPEQQNPLLS